MQLRELCVKHTLFVVKFLNFRIKNRYKFFAKAFLNPSLA